MFRHPTVPIVVTGTYQRRTYDLTGMTIGRIVVHEQHDRGKDHRKRWRCTCHCGAECFLTTSALLDRKDPSCGCSIVIHPYPRRVVGNHWMYDLTGLTFGRLSVLEMEEMEVPTTERRFHWRCLCTCGSTHRAGTDALVWGWTRSCGCLGRFNPLRNQIVERYLEMRGAESATQIAKFFGITKNVVVGIMHREKLTSRVSVLPRPSIHFPDPGTCLFPIGDPKKPGFEWCGVPFRGKGPYCDEHTTLTRGNG